MRMRGEAWPEADALFHSDPRWLGSDDAYSVPLGGDRTLWLFGDTFVGDGVSADRARAHFVRSSIGVMSGADPSSASITFAWGSSPGEPFFDAPAPAWLWPLHGARVGSGLLLFFMLVRPSVPGGSGDIEDWRAHGPLGFFEVFGWTAVRVENPDDEPARWRWEHVAPIAPSRIVLGAGVLREGDHLFLYGWDQAKRVYVARWPVESAVFDHLEWWCGDGWRSDGTPAPIVSDGHTEFTVHRMSADAFCLTSFVGLSPGSLALRTAPAPEGPWSEPAHAFTPTIRDGAFAYAGKAHPQLRGADLVATYASIGDADVTLAHHDLYYPRFIRLRSEA